MSKVTAPQHLGNARAVAIDSTQSKFLHEQPNFARLMRKVLH